MNQRALPGTKHIMLKRGNGHELAFIHDNTLEQRINTTSLRREAETYPDTHKREELKLFQQFDAFQPFGIDLDGIIGKGPRGLFAAFRSRKRRPPLLGGRLRFRKGEFCATNASR